MRLVCLFAATAACFVLSCQAVTAQSAAQRAMMRQQQMAAQRAAQQAAAQRAAAQRAAMERQRALMRQQLAAQRARMVQVQRQQMQRQRALQQKRMDEMRRSQAAARRNAMQKQRLAAKDQSRRRVLVQQLLGRQRSGGANDNTKRRARNSAKDNKRQAAGQARAADLLKQKRFENARALALQRLDRERTQRRNREARRLRQQREKKRREERLITAVRLAGGRGVPKPAAPDNRSKFGKVVQLPRLKSASGRKGGGGPQAGASRGNVSYQFLARRCTRNPDSKTVVLGKDHDRKPNCYTAIAKKNNWTYYATKKPGEKNENGGKHNPGGEAYRRFRDGRGSTEWERIAKADKSLHGQGNRNTGKHIFNFNKAFLDNQLRQGKRIVLAHDPDKELRRMKELRAQRDPKVMKYGDSFYARELMYLKQKGYRWRKGRDGFWEVYK